MQIAISNISGLFLTISGEDQTFGCRAEEDAKQLGESRYWIYEAREYEYKFSLDGYSLICPGVVFPSRLHIGSGRLRPNTAVGTTVCDVFHKDSELRIAQIRIEVLPQKLGFREHYRTMLNDIAEENLNLILQHSSPAFQELQITYKSDYKVGYQQFSFLKSILTSEDFSSAIHRIVSFPAIGWNYEDKQVDLARIKRFTHTTLKEFVSSPRHASSPGKSGSPPLRVTQTLINDTTDIPVNKFVKFALEYFTDFIRQVKDHTSNDTLIGEAEALAATLEEHLDHSFFREISPLQKIPLNNPVLQRKEGYREVLRVWLLFDLAAKLGWDEDIEEEVRYDSRKKNIATLYEYWVFYKLLAISKSLFQFPPGTFDDLIEATRDQLGIKIKQGRSKGYSGEYLNGQRKLRVAFAFNKIFDEHSNPSEEGSWTKTMRPDYTFSIWPASMDKTIAERNNLITHIHFDAKYKIDNLNEIFDPPSGDNDEESLNEEKKQQLVGKYKRADFLKMHAYRDAIRRSGGAYVIYPGTRTDKPFKGYDELMPGIGAFSLNPGLPDGGTNELKGFLVSLLSDLQNRASQWEQSAYHLNRVYSRPLIRINHVLIPDHNNTLLQRPLADCHVLIGYVKSADHYNWILKNRKYNTRTGKSKGRIQINSEEAGAEYLLLYSDHVEIPSELILLNPGGPKFVTKELLTRIGYPRPSSKEYLLFDLQNFHTGIEIQSLNIQSLIQLKQYKIIGAPFAVSMQELFDHFSKNL